MNKTPHIMLIAGEASGDMRAAGLASALKKLDPSLKLSGIGGPYMREAGVECFTDITELAVIGITEVVKNFSRIKKVFHDTLKQIDTIRPDAVILVDYPGFNLRLAREIKKRNHLHPGGGGGYRANPIKIIYYISPQVWAWREKRILKIKKLVDRMIVLFPFEKDIYTKYGMTVDYVGHPLVDEISIERNQTEVLKSLGLVPSKTTIGLMPGSRFKEVERHLPAMLEAAQILFEKNKERQFILLKSPSIPMKLIEKYLSFPSSNMSSQLPNMSSQLPNMSSQLPNMSSQLPNVSSQLPNVSFPNASVGNLKHLPIKIYDGPIYDGINAKRPNCFDFDGINAADALIVASGTATLECALLKKPMVIIYKTSWLTYGIAKAVIKIPYIGLVNVVAGKKIVEELIQNDAQPAKIANALESALHNTQLIESLAQVKTSLGEPGASLRAAEVILEELHVNT